MSGRRRALREWWLVTRKTPSPPESFRRGGPPRKLYATLPSVGRGSQEIKPHLLYVAVQNPNRLHLLCSKSENLHEKCTSIRAIGKRAHLRKLHNKRVREAREGEWQSLFQTRGRGGKTQEAECKQTAQLLTGPLDAMQNYCAEDRQEANDGLNALVEIRNMELLIREHGYCRREARAPSSPRVSLDRCGIVRRWGSSRRSGCTRCPCETPRAAPDLQL